MKFPRCFLPEEEEKNSSLWRTLRRVALSGHQSESFVVFDQNKLEEGYQQWRQENEGTKVAFGELFSIALLFLWCCSNNMKTRVKGCVNSFFHSRRPPQPLPPGPLRLALPGRRPPRLRQQTGDRGVAGRRRGPLAHRARLARADEGRAEAGQGPRGGRGGVQDGGGRQQDQGGHAGVKVSSFNNLIIFY